MLVSIIYKRRIDEYITRHGLGALACVRVWYGATAMMTIVMPMAIVTTVAAAAASCSVGSVSWAHTNNIFQTNIFLDCLFVIWTKQILLRGKYETSTRRCVKQTSDEMKTDKKTIYDKKDEVMKKHLQE